MLLAFLLGHRRIHHLLDRLGHHHRAYCIGESVNEGWCVYVDAQSITGHRARAVRREIAQRTAHTEQWTAPQLHTEINREYPVSILLIADESGDLKVLQAKALSLVAQLLGFCWFGRTD